MKNHRTLATFLLGTSLAVGAVVGLAPTSQAAPSPVDVVREKPPTICQKMPEVCVGPVVVTTKKPPVTFNTIPPVTLGTIPPKVTTTVKPTTTVQPTTTVKNTTTTAKHDDPKPSYPSANPDTPVKGQPVFTG